MRLDQDEARIRLAGHDHGILCTVHPVRGVDAVPVAYVVDADGFVAVPVDRVKPKSSSRLQRERNLEADPRATLLVEHWDPVDWSRLWWVRAELRWVGAVEVGPGDAPGPLGARGTRLAAGLAERYPQYRDEPFARLLARALLFPLATRTADNSGGERGNNSWLPSKAKRSSASTSAPRTPWWR